MTHRDCAFIFARGGSKGLPGKNILELNGKPLIQYSIETAKSLGLFEHIFLSTDCDKIAKIGRDHGLIVINRPSDLAQDNSPEWLAWQHAVYWVEENVCKFSRFVCFPVTSPLRANQDVLNAINKLEESGADLCLGVTETNHNPHFNMVERLIDGRVRISVPLKQKYFRRQDAPKVFNVTTVIFVANVNYIKNRSGIFDGNVVSVEVPKVRAIDIDDIYDFKFAELILNERF